VFQRVLTTQGMVYGPFYLISHLGLARDYAALGRTSDGHAECQSLLEGWLDADPEIPLLKTAQAELTRLR